VESSVYQNFNNETKVKILKKQIEKINKEAGEKIRKNSDIAPYLMRYKIEKMSKDDRRLIDSYLGKDFVDALIKEYGEK